ncbi:MAG: uroporphyrinogen decarboxylase [Actinomycetota bacterium]
MPPDTPRVRTSSAPAAAAAAHRPARFLRACRGEPVDVTPIWMMRQAGRSLPAYRRLRSRYSLLDIAGEPELSARVALMPLRELEVDAVILFADIMLPLAGLGVAFELVDDVGPVIENPIRNITQIKRMKLVEAAESVPAVFETIRLLRKELDGRVPLIGFSGAPFTLASYLIEGRPTRDFSKTKAFMFGQPDAWRLLMQKLTDMVIDYLTEQVAAGAQAFQIFDSWIGTLAPEDVEDKVLPYTSRIFEATAHLDVPRISFGTGTSGFLELMAAPEPEVVGVDWRVPLDAAWDRIGFDRAIQGNLDPAALLAPPDVLRHRALEVLRSAEARPGHIFNLGHGVLPDTPLKNLKLLVDTVHEHHLAY